MGMTILVEDRKRMFCKAGDMALFDFSGSGIIDG
jgi:hypothetical protein